MNDLTLPDEDRALVLGCLDSLAAALTDHGHAWTEGERAIFEQSYVVMGGRRPEFELEQDPGEEWKNG